MKKLLGLVVVLLVLAAGAYWWWQSSAPPLEMLEPAPQAQPDPATPKDEAEILHPLPPPEPEQAELPSLPDSDAAALEALTGMLGKQWVGEYLVPRTIIRNVVVTVDNLPREKVATRLLPLQPPGGVFMTRREGDQLAIDPANSQRYQPFVRALEHLNPATLAAAYRKFYPLFQQAYQDLGYPKGYFNDRLVLVIDHMLAAPVPVQPIALTQPHILYRYADEQLEAASAGHKIMMRMGPEAAARVKTWLRALRTQVAGPNRPR